MVIPYRYLSEDVDRHGNRRLYFRRNGRKIRIRETPGTAEFTARYQELTRAAEAGEIKPPVKVGPAERTLGWLVRTYEASVDFGSLEPSTQATRRRLHARMLDEPVRPDAEALFVDYPLARLRLEGLEVLRDRKRDKPGAANDRVKALRALFKWARAKRLMPSDPAAGLTKIRVVSSGWHTWTVEEVAQFEARHPLGTTANLALRLMLYTGARRSDAVRLGRPHYRDGELRWTAYKNRNRHPVHLVVPVLPPLAEAIEAAGGGGLVFLTTSQGRPFAVAGFGNWFRDRCAEAGLPHCTPHGLRKAGTTMAAEAGASAHQLMSMFGWASLAEAERYTRAAERRRMAADGMGLLLKGMTRAAASGAAPVPLSSTGRTGETKGRKK